jgi:5-methyltetrahydropteroyltriglutamate--homocysteine methyltransferase
VLARQGHLNGRIPAETLRRVEDEAIRTAVQMQEGLGLSVVTDGEFRRGFWHRELPE